MPYSSPSWITALCALCDHSEAVIGLESSIMGSYGHTMACPWNVTALQAYYLPIGYNVQIRVLIIIYKALHDTRLGYLQDCLSQLYNPFHRLGMPQTLLCQYHLVRSKKSNLKKIAYILWSDPHQDFIEPKTCFFFFLENIKTLFHLDWNVRCAFLGDGWCYSWPECILLFILVLLIVVCRGLLVTQSHYGKW